MRRDNISNIHSDIRTARQTRRGSTVAPESAPRGLVKEYPRMPRILLPHAPSPDTSLGEALLKRASHTKTSSKENLTLEKISMLCTTIQKRAQGGRPYPSGGALYPIETYLVGSVEGYQNQVFHYHPPTHSLEQLWQIPTRVGVADILFTPSIEQRGLPPMLLIQTAVWERSACEYGDFAYNLALLEAGHMGQNILLMAASLGVGATPIAGFDDTTVEKILDIDGVGEQAVYSIGLY